MYRIQKREQANFRPCLSAKEPAKGPKERVNETPLIPERAEEKKPENERIEGRTDHKNECDIINIIPHALVQGIDVGSLQPIRN